MKNIDELMEWLTRLLTIGIVVALGMVLLCACKTSKVVEVPVVVEKIHHDTIRSVKSLIERDTTWLHDSVVVRGDCADHWRTEYVYKWRERIDTAYISRVDSVPKVVSVTKTVYKRSGWKYAVKWMGIGAMLMLGLVVAVGLWWKRQKK